MTDTSSQPRERRWPAGSFFVLLAVYALLVAQLDFVTDDAYINFRFARNLAQGHGFVFNPGADGPVEGTSELLWVFLLTPIQALGWNPAFWSRAISIACGFLLLWQVERTLRRDLALSQPATFIGVMFVATMPVFAAWSSGGLSTIPFALVLFELFRQLLVVPAGTNRLACIALLLCGLLLHAESLPWLVGLVALTWFLAQRADEPARLQLARTCAIGLCIGALVLVGVRLAYFGYPLPNVAYAKVGLTATQFMRGAGYLARFFIVFPATAIAVAWIALTLVRARWRDLSKPVLGALGCIFFSAAFCVFVGGDFMAMFRFSVPTMAFLGLLLAISVERFEIRGSAPRKSSAIFAAAVCLANLLVAFGIEPLQNLLNSRGQLLGKRDKQLVELEWQLKDAQLWSDLGRVLTLAAPAGSSLVSPSVGAVGYYSPLTIHDRHGLVSTDVAHGGLQRVHGAAGHDLFVPIAFFALRKPTYAYAGLHTEDELAHPTPVLIKRIFGDASDKDTSRSYRPVVFRVPWLQREERYLLLAERIEPESTEVPDWSGSLLDHGHCRDLPGPATRTD